VTTRGGAIPEVAGDAACYCDPDDPREWREAIWRLLGTDRERVEWVAKGYGQAARFSWSECAAGTLAAYEKAVAARNRRRARA
jgi:glycosyltransferase involved in cell wall biosynthesis